MFMREIHLTGVVEVLLLPSIKCASIFDLLFFATTYKNNVQPVPRFVLFLNSLIRLMFVVAFVQNSIICNSLAYPFTAFR